MDPDFGILIVAFGKQRYIEQANTLARSLRQHMPGTSIACATDARLDPTLFDQVVPIDLRKGGSFIQKLWLDAYTPFKRTLFIDSDCIVGASFHEHVEALKPYAFTPVCDTYLMPGEDDKDGWIRNIGFALDLLGGSKFPKFNGGIYYFDDSEASAKVFQAAREVNARGEELGLLAPTGAGFGDETIYALALASLQMTSLYDDGGSLMRTPIGIRGPIRMNKAYGDFSFLKNGKLVTPAICHFAGSYDRPEYLNAALYLRTGHVPRRFKMTNAWNFARTMAKNYGYTIKRKLYR